MHTLRKISRLTQSTFKHKPDAKQDSWLEDDLVDDANNDVEHTAPQSSADDSGNLENPLQSSRVTDSIILLRKRLSRIHKSTTNLKLGLSKLLPHPHLQSLPQLYSNSKEEGRPKVPAITVTGPSWNRIYIPINLSPLSLSPTSTASEYYGAGSEFDDATFEIIDHNNNLVTLTATGDSCLEPDVPGWLEKLQEEGVDLKEFYLWIPPVPSPHMPEGQGSAHQKFQFVVWIPLGGIIKKDSGEEKVNSTEISGLPFVRDGDNLESTFIANIHQETPFEPIPVPIPNLYSESDTTGTSFLEDKENLTDTVSRRIGGFFLTVALTAEELELAIQPALNRAHFQVLPFAHAWQESEWYSFDCDISPDPDCDATSSAEQRIPEALDHESSMSATMDSTRIVEGLIKVDPRSRPTKATLAKPLINLWKKFSASAPSKSIAALATNGLRQESEPGERPNKLQTQSGTSDLPPSPEAVASAQPLVEDESPPQSPASDGFGELLDNLPGVQVGLPFHSGSGLGSAGLEHAQLQPHSACGALAASCSSQSAASVSVISTSTSCASFVSAKD